jgi:hypothetical protein
VSPDFANYFFRSVIFQQQVEREKRGMCNMTNIFPSQVQDMLIVDVPLARQNELASEVATQLAALQRERDGIEVRRNQINALIEAALTPSG